MGGKKEYKSRDFDEIMPEGSAKLLAYTQILNLPWGFDERFLIIGVTEFENSVKATEQIKADTIDQLKTGVKLKAGWEPIRVVAGEKVYRLKFEP